MEQVRQAGIAHAIDGRGEFWMNETLQRFEELAARAYAGDLSAERDFFFEASQLFPIDFHERGPQQSSPNETREEKLNRSLELIRQTVEIEE